MVGQLTAFTNIWAIMHGDIEQSISFLNDSIAEQNFPLVGGTYRGQLLRLDSYPQVCFSL